MAARTEALGASIHEAMNPYFFSSEKECIDIDECTGEPCAEMEECVNNDGGFQCKCAQEE